MRSKEDDVFEAEVTMVKMLDGYSDEDERGYRGRSYQGDRWSGIEWVT